MPGRRSNPLGGIENADFSAEDAEFAKALEDFCEALGLALHASFNETPDAVVRRWRNFGKELVRLVQFDK